MRLSRRGMVLQQRVGPAGNLGELQAVSACLLVDSACDAQFLAQTPLPAQATPTHTQKLTLMLMGGRCWASSFPSRMAWTRSGTYTPA